MPGNLGKLRVRLGLDDKEFKNGMNKAQAKLRVFSRRLAIAGAAVAGAAASGLILATKNSFATIDAQAKLAQSLGTTTESMQVLSRAGELAGVSFSGIEQGTKDLTRRLSQAAAGGGPAVKTLKQLYLSAADLMALPLNERVEKINQAIEDFVSPAERAAAAGQLFGEEGSIAMSRLDSATLRQATQDVKDFGVGVSEVDAKKIAIANDAISRIGLVAKGAGNQIAVALAPAITAAADALVALFREGGPANVLIKKLGENFQTLASYAAGAALILGGGLATGIARTVLGVDSLTNVTAVLGAVMRRLPFVFLVTAAGWLIDKFVDLVKGSGGFGNALVLLKDVGIEVFERIGAGGTYLASSLGVTFDIISAGWSRLLAHMQKRWADFLHNTASTIRSIPFMSGVADEIGEAAIMAGSKMYELNLATDTARESARNHAAEMIRSAQAMTAPLKSWDALKAALKAAEEQGDSTEDALARVNDQVKDLGDAGGAGGAAGGLEKLLEKLKDDLKGVAENAKSLTEGIKDSLGGTLGGVLEAALDKTQSVRGALANVFADLARMASNQLIQGLLNSAFGTAGSGGGFLKAVGVPGFATGTNFAPGGVALVGERGPELVNLPRGSQVFPNDQVGGLAGGVTINNIFDPNLIGDFLNTPQGDRLIMNKIERATRA